MLYLMETRNRSKTFVPLKGGAATVHVRYSARPLQLTAQTSRVEQASLSSLSTRLDAGMLCRCAAAGEGGT